MVRNTVNSTFKATPVTHVVLSSTLLSLFFKSALRAKQAPSEKKRGKIRSPEDEAAETPFLLRGGDSFRLPLALLYKSSEISQGKSLGFLSLRPSDLTPVLAALDEHMQLGHDKFVQYNEEEIDLAKIVSQTAEMLNSPIVTFGEGGLIIANDENQKGLQLSCSVQSGGNSDLYPGHDASDVDGLYRHTSMRTKLPSFCYNVEVNEIPVKTFPFCWSMHIVFNLRTKTKFAFIRNELPIQLTLRRCLCLDSSV